MPKLAKEVIKSINILKTIQTLEWVAENGKNESARVAAAFKLLEVAGVARGEGAGIDEIKDFYKDITQPDGNKLEETSQDNQV